jgi:predicted amidohydrolase YtcJ
MPEASGIAVSGDRIVAVGSFEELRAAGHAIVDETVADDVVCWPGAR